MLFLRGGVFARKIVSKILVQVQCSLFDMSKMCQKKLGGLKALAIGLLDRLRPREFDKSGLTKIGPFLRKLGRKIFCVQKNPTLSKTVSKICDFQETRTTSEKSNLSPNFFPESFHVLVETALAQISPFQQCRNFRRPVEPASKFLDECRKNVEIFFSILGFTSTFRSIYVVEKSLEASSMVLWVLDHFSLNDIGSASCVRFRRDSTVTPGLPTYTFVFEKFSVPAMHRNISCKLHPWDMTRQQEKFLEYEMYHCDWICTKIFETIFSQVGEMLRQRGAWGVS